MKGSLCLSSIVLFVGIVLLAVGTLGQAEASGNDTACVATADDGQTIFSSADSTAVQNAVDAASIDATIKISGTCAGVTTQDIAGEAASQTVYINKSLTLEGGYHPTDWNTSPNSNANPTILDATQVGRVVVLHNPIVDTTVQITLSHLIIQNGSADETLRDFSGGGISVKPIIGGDVEANINNSTIANNSGNGVFNDGELRITNSALISNTAGSGGGIYNYYDGLLIIVNSTIIGNSAENFGGGGGIFNRYGTAIVVGSTLSGNSAHRGGAIESQGKVTVRDSTIVSNTVTNLGGGINGYSQVIINNSTISNNKAFEGGGIRMNSSFGSLEIYDSILSNNTTESNGAGIDNYSPATIDNCTFSNNEARHDGGGIHNESTMTVNNSTFASNFARWGGGIASSNDVIVTNSTLFDNRARRDGGGIYNQREATLTHTTIVKNRASTGGGVASVGIATNLRANIITENIGDSLQASNISDSNTFSSTGYNVIGPIGNSVEVVATDSVEITSTQVAPLANNGGATQTHALLIGSIAINKVISGNCPSTDQRNYPRSDGMCDSGAFEFEAVPLAITTVSSAKASGINWQLILCAFLLLLYPTTRLNLPLDKHLL